MRIHSLVAVLQVDACHDRRPRRAPAPCGWRL